MNIPKKLCSVVLLFIGGFTQAEEFQLFQIIKNDVDYEIIFPNIVSYHHDNLPKFTPEE